MLFKDARTGGESETAQGKTTVEEILKKMRQWGDEHRIVVKAKIKEPGQLETARQKYLSHILSNLDSETRAVIFERRQTAKQNNIDRGLVKKLRTQKLLPQATRTLWVTPTDEQLLWLPDAVAMTYRRTITHTNETSKLFGTYLAEFTTVSILADSDLNETTPDIDQEGNQVTLAGTLGSAVGLLEEGDLEFRHEITNSVAQDYESQNVVGTQLSHEKSCDNGLEN